MARATHPFQVFAKPIGAQCNLRCHYCYYLGKQQLFPGGESRRMPADLLEEYIVQTFEASPDRASSFLWHGGEPMLLGLDYFREIVALQRRHAPPGWNVVNGLQTNGTLLDEEWCRFLAAEGFVVGLSLDGPARLHDAHRVSAGERPTQGQVLRAYRLLRRHRITTDLLCVVHAENVHHPIPVYRFFRELKAQSLTFLPLVEPQPDVPGGVSARSVPPEALGDFLCTVFDEWVSRDLGRILILMFDEALRAPGDGRSLCLFRRTCGELPVVEHNGDFFACDHFVDPDHRFGNLRETRLADLLESPDQRAFGRAKWDTLPGRCRTCAVGPLCHGGCPKDRILRTADGEPGLNYLCAAFEHFFTHTRPHADRLAALRTRASAPPGAHAAPRASASRAGARRGRNEPCPCGSGRKYKRCCLAPRPG